MTLRGRSLDHCGSRCSEAGTQHPLRSTRTSRPTTRSYRDATSWAGEARRTSRGLRPISNRPSSGIRTTLPPREAADRALALDRNLAEAHLADASIKQRYEWDWSAADAAVQRALAL